MRREDILSWGEKGKNKDPEACWKFNRKNSVCLGLGIQTGKMGWAYIMVYILEVLECLDGEYKTDQTGVGKLLPF